MKKLLFILIIGSVSIKAANPKIIVQPPCPKALGHGIVAITKQNKAPHCFKCGRRQGFIRVGIKNPPVGKRFALMFSKDLKSWSIAKSSDGRDCIRTLPSTTKSDGLIVWWYITVTTNEGFYRVSR